MKSAPKKMNKNVIFTIGIGVLLLCLIGLSIGPIWAMYATEKNSASPYAAPEFYFESDLLDGGTHTLGKNTNDITFKLKNYADELRVSDSDIEYTVILQPDNASPTTKEGKLTGGAANEVTVTFDNLDRGMTYTVTARTTKPYVKTITATFKFDGAIDNKIKASTPPVNDGNVLKFTLSTVDFSGNVTIVYPESISPDNTDPLMASAGTGSHTVEFKNNSTHAFVFFKADPAKTYTVTVNGTTVTIAEAN